MLFRIVLGRTLAVILVMVGAATIVFAVLRLSGDPVLLYAAPDTPLATLERIRQELGFDAPMYIQYLRYLGSLARGDLGYSLRYEQPVVRLLLERLPATLALAGAAFVIALILGVSAGLISAVRRGSVYDQISVAGALLGQAVPPFWLGLMLILVFGVYLRVLPTSGSGGIRHLVLPAFTLGAFFTARIARLTRTAFLEVLGEDYLRTARAKGLPERRVLIRHAAPNAAIPIVTVLAVTLSQLVGGAIVTETVFAWPGMGRLMVQGVLARDYPLVQGAVLLIAALVAVISFATDLLYAAVDPRAR